MKKVSKFQRGSAGTISGVYTCRGCGKRTRETGECESGVGLCAACYEMAGLENEHLDGNCDPAHCPFCKQ